jgi:hypothetical protein
VLYTMVSEDAPGVRPMDGLTLLVVFALASTLAVAGARAVLAGVLHLMATVVVPAPVRQHKPETPQLQ